LWVLRNRAASITNRRYTPQPRPIGMAAGRKGLSILDFRLPAAGFDQPLELWLACHERVRRMTGLLERLREHIAHMGADDAARVTATTIRRYFTEAAPRHHQDEEVDLFPLLRQRLPAQAPERAAEVAAALDRLEADHISLGAIWDRLQPGLAAIERGEPAALDGDDVRAFAAGYRAHCEVEDTVVADALRLCLTEADLDALGQAMAERRGVDWTHLHSSRGAGARR
jgi:hemerythrin-like domain-containing protein